MGGFIMNEAEERLAKLGLELPAPPQPVANCVPFRLAGDQLFISGQISRTARGRGSDGVIMEIR